MCKREEDRIYEMFKNGIDEVAFKSIEEDDLDSIQTYINIMEKVNQLSYKVYASLNGVDSSINYSMNFYSIPISDELSERICDYIKPYLENAKSELKARIEDVLKSKTVGELLVKYSNLSRVFDNGIFIENIDLFADIEIGSKKKELTK